MEQYICPLVKFVRLFRTLIAKKKNMVTLINTSDVLEGRVLNHERVPNSNLKGQFKKTFQRDDIFI